MTTQSQLSNLENLDITQIPWFIPIKSKRDFDDAVEFLVREGYGRPEYTYETWMIYLTNSKSRNPQTPLPMVMYGEGQEANKERVELTLMRKVFLACVTDHRHTGLQTRICELEAELALLRQQLSLVGKFPFTS